MKDTSERKTGSPDPKELKKLNREQLLRIMLSQNRELDRLKAALEADQKQLEERAERLSGAENLADACAALNCLDAAVQDTADQYLANILRICGERAAEAGKSKAWELALKALEKAPEKVPEMAPAEARSGEKDGAQDR